MLSLLFAIASLTAPVTSQTVAPAPPVAVPVAAPTPPMAPSPSSAPSSPPASPAASPPASDETTYSADYTDYDEEERTQLLDPNKMGSAYDNARKDVFTQWDFPGYKVDPPPEWLKSLIKSFRGTGDFFRILFYVLVGIFALAILYALFPPFRDLVNNMFGRLRAKKGDEDEEDWAPQTAVAVELLAEADKLAAEGRYAEAVHLLLGRSIEDIGRRRPQLLRPALTARDIARSPDLPEAAREAFTTIANVVEISHFGRRPVDADGWQQCRDAYSRFALRESWSTRGGDAPSNEMVPA